MELIKINDRKLKIMMTSEDMAEYELTRDNIDYENVDTRRALRSIFATAKQRTGFDASSERVFVQMYPSKAGGCEMYITKLGDGDIKTRDLCSEKQKTVEIYHFDAVKWLIDACLRLENVGYFGESMAYYDMQNNGYYLVLCDSLSGSQLSRTYCLKEYGKQVDKCTVGMYIKEYCKCICASRAVGVLSKM